MTDFTKHLMQYFIVCGSFMTAGAMTYATTEHSDIKRMSRGMMFGATAGLVAASGFRITIQNVDDTANEIHYRRF